jgi:hypothetical protein
MQKNIADLSTADRRRQGGGLCKSDGIRSAAAVRGVWIRRKNQAAWVIWERLILCGAIEPPVVTRGFLTGPGWAGIAGSMFKRKGRWAAL